MATLGIIRAVGVNYHTDYSDKYYPGKSCRICGEFSAAQPRDEYREWAIYGGRMYHIHDLIEYQGFYYCPWHFNFKFNRKLREENIIEYEELDAYPEVE